MLRDTVAELSGFMSDKYFLFKKKRKKKKSQFLPARVDTKRKEKSNSLENSQASVRPPARPAVWLLLFMR